MVWFYSWLFLSLQIIYTAASKGCVELDEQTFDKIVKRFKYTLVKFDVAFPYGDKHEAFIKFAADANEIDDLLFALVSIKDYGEKENMALAKRFNIPEIYPAITLFKNTTVTTFDRFPNDDQTTVENLRKFVNSYTDLFISLPGCLKEVDKLAVKFGLKGNSKQTLNSIVSEVSKLKYLYNTEKAQFSYNIYLTLMKKMLDVKQSVSQFIDTEKSRVQKLLTGTMSDSKKKDLNIKLNIMESFRQHTKSVSDISSDEL